MDIKQQFENTIEHAKIRGVLTSEKEAEIRRFFEKGLISGADVEMFPQGKIKFTFHTKPIIVTSY